MVSPPFVKGNKTKPFTDFWKNLPLPEKANLAEDAGLTRAVGYKRWEDLTPTELELLTKFYGEVEPLPQAKIPITSSENILTGGQFTQKYANVPTPKTELGVKPLKEELSPLVKPVIPPEELAIPELVETITPEIEISDLTPKILPGFTAQDLPALLKEDADLFIKGIGNYGRNTESERFLTLLGVSSEDADAIFDEVVTNKTIKKVFGDVTREDLGNWAQENPLLFRDKLRIGGRTPEKEQMLRNFGATQEAIEDIFSIEKLIVPVNGIRQLVNVKEGKAYDNQGKWVGTYNPITREYEPAPEESIGKDILDAFYLGARKAWHQTGSAFTDALPKLYFRDLTSVERKLWGDAEADRINAFNQRMRDKFTKTYTDKETQFKDWEAEHPELMNQREGTAGFLVGLVESVPLTLAAGAVTTAGVATKNPYVTLAGGALFFPSITQDSFQALKQAGATEEQSAVIAPVVGALVSAIEVFGDIPYLKTIIPSAVKLFRKEVVKELSEYGLKQGIKTSFRVPITESLEEGAQQIVQNVAERIFNKHKDVLEQVPASMAGGFVMGLPLGIVGGGSVALTRVPPAQVRGKTDVELEAQGFVKKEGKWYQQLKEALAGERGSFKPFEELGGEPTPESEIAQYQQYITDLKKDLEAVEGAEAEKIQSQIRYAETRIRDLQKLSKTTPEQMKTIETLTGDQVNAFQQTPEGKASFERQKAERNRAKSDVAEKDAWNRHLLRAAEWQSKQQVRPSDALINEGQKLVKQAEVIQADNPDVIEFKKQLGIAQTNESKERLQALRKMEDLEAKVRKLIPVTPEVTPSIRIKEISERLKQINESIQTTKVGRPSKKTLAIREKLQTEFDTLSRESDKLTQQILHPELVTPTAPAVEIPTAESGQPEAGLQPSMIPEEVAPAELIEPENTTLPMPDNVTVSEDRVISPPTPAVPSPVTPPPTPPPGVTPTPAVPSPVAGRITMPDLQAPQTVVDLYSKPDFWRRAANLPLVKKAVGLINPAAVANDPAKQALILRAALKDEGSQKAQAVMSHLWEIGTQERIWGKTDEHGYLLAEQFAGFSIDDIRTNPGKFAGEMTTQQKEWIKRASEIEKAKLDALRRNEIEINELSFEDGGEYAGRRVMGKFNDSDELIESGRISVGGRVGVKQAFEKTRVFKTAQEGIEAGYRYMNSDEALYYNTVGAYNKIADKGMAEWLLSKVDWRTTAAPEALVLQAEAAHIRLRKAQQLQAALNRAVRGERVPSNTINSIGSVYTDQADTLRNLIPELQKPSPQTADIVLTLNNEVKTLIADAKLEYAQAVNERARAREEAMRVKYEEASIAHPAFQGKVFTGAEAKEIADILNRGLQPQFNEALGAVNKVNAIGRFFMLAGDVSPMAIQLQFLAFYRPVAYAKSMGGFVKAMFDPEFQYRYYARHRDLINRHPTLILSGRGTEFTELMGRGGLGKKLGIVTKPLVPFQKAFEGSIDVAGIELAKSLDHLATTPERTLEVDQFINEFRGLTSSARIGVSSTQRQAETAILLAPRYNRAVATYLFDIVHGGIRGHQARMSLAQGLAGLSGMAVAVSLALGEDDDEIWQHFDPRSPKFFTWDVFGVKIGLGGKVRSILKMFGNMLRTGEVGQPALNFLRGNLSPGASTGLDLLTGKNYIGEPTRDNVLDFTKTVGRNFMMIWVQNLLLEGGTLKDKALIATAEFFGLRGYDISAKKELKIKDLEDRLGEVVGKVPVLTKKKPDIYDTRNIYSDAKKILKNIPSKEILADAGYTGWGHLVAKIRDSEANLLPDIAFKDYNFDKSKGETFDDYIRQIEERRRIIEQGERATYTRVRIVEGKETKEVFRGLEALTAHQSDYPNAQRGNLTKREIELLLEYNIAVYKKKFVEEHPEINVNRKLEWFKSHPKENAEFALVGQANLLSKKAYTEFQGLLKELDIPNSAVLPDSLPPEKSIDAYFKYQDMENKNSWEAQLLVAKDEELRKFLEREPIETPTASLELKVKNRKLFDLRDGYSDKESPDYIADKNKRAEAIKKLKTDNPVWVDDMQRIESLEKGTNEKPTDPKIVDAWVEYGKISAERLGYDSETKVWLLDNKYVHQWALTNKLLTDDGSDWNEPVLRINVKWREQDNYYNNEIPKRFGGEPSALYDKEIARQRQLYLEQNPEYRNDRYRREFYQITLPEEKIKSGLPFKIPEKHIETYVRWYADEDLKRPKNWTNLKGEDLSWFEDDWFLQENPEFHKAMVDYGVFEKPRDFKKVPTRQIGAKLIQYEKLTNDKDRDTFRLTNPDLDKWGVSIEKWERTMTEKRRRQMISPGERYIEDIGGKQKAFEERLNK